MFGMGKSRVQMEARQQLVALLERTIEDLSSLFEKAEYLNESIKAKDVVSKAKKMIDFFREIKESIIANSFVDTKDNVEKTKKLCDEIASFRNELFFNAVETSLNSWIEKVRAEIEELQKSSPFGKYVSVTPYKLEKGEIDYAIYVFEWLVKTKKFFARYDEQRRKIRDVREDFIDNCADEYRTECCEKLNALMAEAEAMTEEQYEKNKYYIEEQKESLMQSIYEREMEIACINSTVQVNLNRIEERECIDDCVNDLKRIFDYITNNSDFSYRKVSVISEFFLIGSDETHALIMISLKDSKSKAVKEIHASIKAVLSELENR